MSSLTNIVDTIFHVGGAAAYTAQLMKVGSAAEAAGNTMSASLQRITAMAAPVTAALGGMFSVDAISRVTELGSAFEGTQRRIAGTYAALGQAQDYTAGLRMAESSIRRIMIDSAALPGEASEYLEVWQTAMPQILQSFHGTQQEALHFSDRFAAVANTLGVDISQAGFDLTRMLAQGHGQVERINSTFRRLLPFIEHMTEGTANHVRNAQDFNKLSQDTRSQILQQLVNQGQLNTMLDAASQSWDAQVGALQTIKDTMFRLSTSPLFDALKAGLGRVNALFMDSEGNFTQLGSRLLTLGQLFTTALGGPLDSILNALEGMSHWVNDIIDSLRGGPLKELASAFAGVGHLANAASAGAGAGGGARLAGAGVGAAAVGGAGLALMGPVGALLAPIGAILGSGIADFMSRTSVVGDVIGRLAHLFDDLTAPLAPVIDLFSDLGSMLADAAANILPSLITGLDNVLTPIMNFVGAIFAIGRLMFTELRPALYELWGAIGKIIDAFSLLFGSTTDTQDVITGLVFMLSSMTQIIVETIGAFTVMARNVADFANWLHTTFGIGNGGNNAGSHGGATPLETKTMLDQLMGLFGDHARAQDADSAIQHQREQGAAMTQHGGTQTNQDFRYSRFDITQKFAEGFDPDRIAVALASDIGTAGTQRFDSSLSPLFGLR